MNGQETAAVTSIAMICVAAVMIFLIQSCTEPGDRLAQALAVCGDTPPTVTYQYQGRGVAEAQLEARETTYALQVKSVDDCRKAVIEHFNQNKGAS